MFSRLRNKQRFRGVVRAAYSVEALALFARMSVQPDATRKALINDRIKALKASGAWGKLDFLHFEAAHDAQAARLNWVSSSYDLITIAGPVFTVDRGYAGDGATSYLQVSGYNPSAAPKMVQNSAHMGYWGRLNAPNVPDAGMGSDGSHHVNLRATVARARLYSSVGYFPNVVNGIGHVIGRRDAINQEAFRNGVSLGSAAVTNASTGTTLTIGNVGGVFTTQQFAVTHGGADLTAAEVLSLYNEINTYLVAVGAA